MGLSVSDDGKAAPQHRCRADTFEPGDLVLQFQPVLGEVVVHGTLKTFTRFILILEKSTHALGGRVPLKAVFREQQVLSQGDNLGVQSQIHSLAD